MSSETARTVGLACLLALVCQAQSLPAVTAVVGSASFQQAVAPGGAATIYGTNLAASIESAATTVSLPQQLAGTTVLIRNNSSSQSVSAPLYYVSPRQINFQVPFEIAAAPAELTVSSAAGTSDPFPVPVQAVAPEIFSMDGSGQGEALVFDVAFNPLTSVRVGVPLVFYATGLGATVPPGATGSGGSAVPPYNTVATPIQVFVGDVPATVDWAGLAPGLAGVYQLNVTPLGLAGPDLFVEVANSSPAVRSNILLLPGDPGGTLDNIQVLGTTATQAVISYTAPSSDACSIQLSETNQFGAGYAPVNDVNPQFFPGSDQDTRPGSVSAGLNRIVVLGSRAAVKSGSVFYSRALQAGTPHYFRIVCGAAIAVGAFTTGNIPVGNTWEDPLPADPDSPGAYAWPTLDTSSRSNFVIDPDTGVKIQVLTRPGDISGTTPANTLTQVDGAGCASTPVTTSDGKVGYHCKIVNALYWVEKGGASSRLLGGFQFGANPAQGRNTWSYCRGFPFSSDPNTFYCLYANGDAQHIFVVKGVYTGHARGLDADTYSAPIGMALANWSNVTPQDRHLLMLAQEFDPTFAPSVTGAAYAWIPIGVQNDKLVINVTMNGQDSLGWHIVFDPLLVGSAPGCVGAVHSGQPGCVVGIHSTFGGGINTPNRWCTDHGISDWPTIGPWLSPAANPLMLNRVGGGPYTVPVVAVDGTPGVGLMASGGPCPERPSDSPIPASQWPCAPGLCSAAQVCTPMTLFPGAEPASAYPPASLGPLQPGDLVDFALDYRPGSSSELARVLVRNGANIWVQRGYDGSKTFAVAAPVQLYMVCNSYDMTNARGLWWWNWAQDPHGTNTSYNTTGIGGHRDFGTLPFRSAYVGVGPDYQYGINTNPLPQALANPPAYSITFFPQFAAMQLYGTGTNNLESHLRYTQSPDTELESRWVADARPYFGDTSIVTAPRVVQVTGNLYRINGLGPLTGAYKLIPLAASSSKQVLTEISRPGQVPSDWPGIGGASQDQFKFCVALQPGECYQGSSAGDVYVNAPGVTYPYCTSSRFASSNQDICLTQQISALQSLVQVDITHSDPVGANTRVISRGLTSYRGGGDYWAALALPDGRAILADVGPLSDGSMEVALLRQPPWPAQSDGLDRTTFVAVPAAVPQPGESLPSATDNVVVEFGYDMNFYCTKRAEACVASGDTVNAAVPFYYAGADSYSGHPCGSGCTVALPATSQRVVYYHVKYRDAANNLIGTGPTRVALAP